MSKKEKVGFIVIWVVAFAVLAAWGLTLLAKERANHSQTNPVAPTNATENAEKIGLLPMERAIAEKPPSLDPTEISDAPLGVTVPSSPADKKALVAVADKPPVHVAGIPLPVAKVEYGPWSDWTDFCRYRYGRLNGRLIAQFQYGSSTSAVENIISWHFVPRDDNGDEW
jgi:hypothetical protein